MTHELLTHVKAHANELGLLNWEHKPCRLGHDPCVIRPTIKWHVSY